MPLLGNTMDHEVLGRENKKGLQEGREEGLREGVTWGELKLLRHVVQRRFGPIPDWASQQLNNRSPQDIEALTDLVLECSSLNELLARLKPALSSRR